MSLAFDTSILIEIERRNPKIIEKINNMSESYPTSPQLPFISYYEFIQGLKIKNPKDYEKKFAFANKFSVLKTSKKSAEILADLKIKYEKIGFSFPLADLLIAAQTIENNLILISLDKDFEKIEELKKIIL